MPSDPCKERVERPSSRAAPSFIASRRVEATRDQRPCHGRPAAARLRKVVELGVLAPTLS